MDNRQNRLSEDRRNGPRRSGLGRRIHGERRTTELPQSPAGLAPTWKARQGQRRDTKRRIIPDRRAGQGVPSTSKR
jgi:hypothetical protein